MASIHRGLDRNAEASGAATRVALSTLFASLISACAEFDGDGCGPPRAIDVVLTVTEPDYNYFASSDGVLDPTECVSLCRCFAVAGSPGVGTGGSSQGPACARGVGAWDPGRFEACEDRGTNGGFHRVYCKGDQYDAICGRDGACNVALGQGLGPTEVARWLAFSAATEAASVWSFLSLARELEALGAPRALSDRARRAATDEVRHARAVLHLARSRGGVVEWPNGVRLAPRSLETVATENAVEGVVRETWAALLNSYQAVHARAPDVRGVMARIAADETEHAELARDIHTWSMILLPRRARRRIEEAMRSAAVALVAGREELPSSVRFELGLPQRDVRRFLAGKLSAALWVAGAHAARGTRATLQ